MKKVIVVAVHPDDETLGAGGTILRHIENGDEVHWLIVTGIDENLGYTKEIISQREEEIKKVEEAYSFTKTHSLKFPTTELDSIHTKELVTKISKIFKEVQPEVVYLPFSNDVHSDHKVAFNAFFSCTKSFRYPSIKRVLMMETLSETNFTAPHLKNFIPNVYVDISKHIKRKNDIMKIYSSELGEHPFPRSIKAIESLAILRGSESNSIAAESFMLLKEII